MIKTNGFMNQDIASKAPLSNSIINILLVDDDKINRFLTSKILSRTGFNIEVAGDSDEALDWLHKKQFDLVLMDIRLPGMSGIELTEYIRNKHLPFSNVPIFALTSSTLESVKKLSLEAGINEYFTKPYNSIELQQVIIKYINQIKVDH